MKKFVIAAMIAAGVAMCAAVWPHGNVVEETPAPATETAVSAQCKFRSVSTTCTEV